MLRREWKFFEKGEDIRILWKVWMKSEVEKTRLRGDIHRYLATDIQQPTDAGGVTGDINYPQNPARPLGDVEIGWIVAGSGFYRDGLEVLTLISVAPDQARELMD